MKLVSKCKELLEKFHEHNNVPQEVKEVVDAFGGINNILAMNNSVSELRYDLKDLSKLNRAELEKLGAKKVTVFDREKHVQVCFGEDVQELSTLIKKYACKLREENQEVAEVKAEQDCCKSDCKCDDAAKCSTSECGVEPKKEFKAEIEVLAPVSGKIVSFADLNHYVFSNNMVGNGVAIEFDLNQDKIDVLAPFSGKISMMPANKTQVILTSPCGVETVILIGQDSAKLDGIGFDVHYNLNDMVPAGKAIMTLNLNKFREEQADNHIVISTTADSRLQSVSEVATQAKAGEKLFKLS
ncbi:PTS glucose transporter subunit IIA [Mycoplasma hafezii]|uniref:PTS sugar transporter subunit IIA n=1 Tax=Mycoplasma hafezii TaxID=525886 RepID=UPI003CF18EAF